MPGSRMVSTVASGSPPDPMKAQRKYTDEQSISVLLDHEGGVTAREIIRRYGNASRTFCHWMRKYSG